MKDRIDEHDMTKKMMDIMRGGYKGLINEVDYQDAQTEIEGSSAQVNPSDLDQSQEAPLPSDTIQLRPTDATYQTELQTMRDTVDESVNFTSFNIYPEDENVVIDGYLEKRNADNSGIFFKMDKNASDIETSMVDVELDDEINEIMKRLTGYYQIFVKTWKKNIHEYKPNSDN